MNQKHFSTIESMAQVIAMSQEGRESAFSELAKVKEENAALRDRLAKAEAHVATLAAAVEAEEDSGEKAAEFTRKRAAS